MCNNIRRKKNERKKKVNLHISTSKFPRVNNTFSQEMFQQESRAMYRFKILIGLRANLQGSLVYPSHRVPSTFSAIFVKLTALCSPNARAKIKSFSENAGDAIESETRSSNSIHRCHSKNGRLTIDRSLDSITFSNTFQRIR